MTKRRTGRKCKWCGRPIYEYKIGSRGWFGGDRDSCGCEEKKKEREQQKEWEKRMEQERLNKLFRQSQLGKHFWQRTFENFKINSENRKAYETALDYVENFQKNSDKGRGLIFIGKVGTGKTHLASAIFKKVLCQFRTGIFKSVPELLDEIRATYRENVFGSGAFLEKLKEVDLLVLDDIGKEKPTEWARERLFVIINSRYEAVLPTIFTTNCKEEELKQKIGEAITSRMYETCEPVLLTGSDHRRK